MVKEFFGDIAPEVKRLDIDPDGLRFEIVFIPSETKKVIITDTIEYGAQYSLSKVREAIEEAFPMRTTSFSSSTSRKMYKRTVVLWDGAHIKKGVDGVTYVPRVAPTTTYGRTTILRGSGWIYDNRNRYREDNTYARWQSLYEEAQKQECAERSFYERQNASREKSAQNAMSQAERDYAARIDRIYNNGMLYFRAKVDKRK